MNFDYPDLGGSIHVTFDTQLPGAAIDSPSQSQESVWSSQSTAHRPAKKAPAQEPNPPSFGLFNKLPYSSGDRTQEPFFPAMISSIGHKSPASEPTSVHQIMMVAICKTTSLIEMFNHKIDDLNNNSIKTNPRVNLLSHAMEEVILTLNKNLHAFEKLQKTLEGQKPTSVPCPTMPLPSKPVPEIPWHLIRKKTTPHLSRAAGPLHVPCEPLCLFPKPLAP